jgi:hypothetical protein
VNIESSASRRGRWLPLACLAGVIVHARPAAALDVRPQAVGVEVDLLPTIASAVAGEAGGALQVWGGRGRDRLRVVGAHLHYPDGLTESPFARRSTTAVALLYDRFFREGFRGPWVAAGLEYWWSEIGLEAGAGTGSWDTPVATVGAGWVFPVWRRLYLNPWAAVHAPLDTGSVDVGGEQYEPRAIEAEVSLKIGWGIPLLR